LFSIKRTLYPLVVPATLVMLSTLTAIKWPDLVNEINQVKELRAVMVILPVVPYLIFSIGFVMGWRYNNTGMVLGTLALAGSYFAVNYFRSPALPDEAVAAQSVTDALAFLLPLNLAFCSTLTKRRIFTSVGVLSMILLIVQVLGILIFCHPEGDLHSWFTINATALSPAVANKLSGLCLRLDSAFSDRSIFGFVNLPTPAVFAFALALFFVLFHFIQTGDIKIGGFFFATLAVLLGLAARPTGPAVILYFTAAGLILVVTVIEASFSMAYIDELTGLPGRRSFNETLLNMGKKYTIAMIDVDHFKKINDTHGHKIGDQVLKMIASRLGKINGGAKTFRYGGEEFAAIFTGKTVEDAILHLEDFRQAVESNPFLIRGKERRKRSRNFRGKNLSTSTRKLVKVTVSIGLASPGKESADPDYVVKAADKKLYRAKENGRNRIAC